MPILRTSGQAMHVTVIHVIYLLRRNSSFCYYDETQAPRSSGDN